MSMEKCCFSNNKLITVLGGSGFVGRYIVATLAKQGYRIRIVSRNPEKKSELIQLGKVGQIQIIKANIRYPQTIHKVLKDADVIINLISISYERGKQTFKAVNVEGARLVAEICSHLKVPLIHFSALGSNELAKSSFARSKAAGEKNVRQYYPDSIIIRPAIMFGREDKNFYKVANNFCYLPFIPLINHGKNKIQPVYVKDVALMTAKIIENMNIDKKIFELAGPKTLTVKEICNIILKNINRKRYFIPISVQLSYFLAGFFEFISKINKKPPVISKDFILSLQTDNILSPTAKSNGKTFEYYDITPQSLEIFLQENLKRFRATGIYPPAINE